MAENITGCLILTVRPLFVVQYVLPKQMFNNKATVQCYIEDMTRFIGVQRIRTVEREGILKILSVQFSHFINEKTETQRS